MKQSKKWQFNKADTQRWIKNALLFLSAPAITCLLLLQQGVTNPEAYYAAIQVWGIGVALDFFRKLQAGK